MGVVWRAHDELLDRAVAIKEVLYHALGESDRAAFTARTIREARAAGRLTHPNVVVVHDVIEEDGRPWIVMQLVNSRSLGDVLKELGALPPEQVASIGAQVLDALRTAHAAGVMHRDVKPENVLLGSGGRVVLTDFGIATMTQESALTMSGVVTGTPAFLPPERLNGLPATPESDLWALGATLYAAVEGRPPFDRGAPVPTMAAILHDDAAPMRNAGPLEPVVEGLMRKDPARRMTAVEAAERLARIAAGDPAPSDTRPSGRPTGRPGGTRPPSARRRPLVALAVLVPLILAAGALYWYTQPLGPVPSDAAAPATGTAVPTPGGTAHKSRTARPTPPPSSEPTAVASVDAKGPNGWVRHRDPAGFTVALPPGWTAFDRKPTSVKFHGPGSKGYLHIDWTVPEERLTDPVKSFLVLERRVLAEGTFRGYHRIAIETTTFLDRPAAAWSFTWTPPSGRKVRVLDIGFRTAEGRPYAMYWQAPLADWNKDLRLQKVFADTFRPA
jgi:serine/threonine protein kinase